MNVYSKTETDTENKLGVIRGEREGERRQVRSIALRNTNYHV